MSTRTTLNSDLMKRLGDLTLIVGISADHHSGPQSFLIISKTLRLASPVWDVMIKPEGHFLAYMRFPDDHPKIFEFALKILFHDPLPRRLNLKTLIAVVAFADKYDCVPAIRGYILGKLPSYKEELDMSYCKMERLLNMAWDIGDYSFFCADLRGHDPSHSIR